MTRQEALQRLLFVEYRDVSQGSSAVLRVAGAQQGLERLRGRGRFNSLALAWQLFMGRRSRLQACASVVEQ